jgi:hypothetical protein
MFETASQIILGSIHIFPIFFHIFLWFSYDFPITTLSKQLDELGSRALDCQSPAPWRESSHPYQPKLRLWKMVR